MTDFHKLALKLEELGLWKTWLGEEKQRVFLRYLSDQGRWEHFLNCSDAEHSRADFELCMQVRCLLYGEMAVALYSSNCTGISRRPDSVYHTLDHSIVDWQRLSGNSSSELAGIRQKFGLNASEEQEHTAGKSIGEGEDGSSERHKPRSKASREIMSLMPDVKPGKKDLVEDRQNELNDALEHVLTELKYMGEASKPFHCRVKKSEAWDYYTVIQRPMDLGTMTKKLRAYKYHSKISFRDDIDLIASNCHEYNEKESLYVQYVDELQARAYALLEEVPDIDVLTPKSASGKHISSPVRFLDPSEPSSPDSQSDDDGKARPGFGGFGRHQPGKRMRGKAGAIGKRLLREGVDVNGRGDVNGPSTVTGQEADVGTGGALLVGEHGGNVPAVGDASPVLTPDVTAGVAASSEGRSGVNAEPTERLDRAMSAEAGADVNMVAKESECREARHDVSPSHVTHRTMTSQPGFKADDPTGLENDGALQEKEGSVDTGDNRWPFDDWLQSNLRARMERLAERAAARHVAFADQPALVRTPKGMARYMEEAVQKGFGALRETDAAGSAGEEAREGVVETGGVTSADKLFMPELRSANDGVPEVAVISGRSSASAVEAAWSRELVSEPPAKRLKQSTGSPSDWSDECARAALRQVAAKLVAREGFEGLRRGALEVLADLLGAHIRKLGRTVRLLEERYGGQSPERLLQMCLNGFGVRNVAELAAYTRPKEDPPAETQSAAHPAREAQPNFTTAQPAKAPKPDAKPDSKVPVLPVRPLTAGAQFPSVPVFKGVLPKVESEQEKSVVSAEPEKKKAKPRVKKAAATPPAASARFPGLKTSVAPPTSVSGLPPTAALGLPSPVVASYSPIVSPNGNPLGMLYGGMASTGVLRSPNVAYGVPLGMPSTQPLRVVGSPSLYSSPSLEAISPRPLKEQASKQD